MVKAAVTADLSVDTLVAGASGPAARLRAAVAAWPVLEAILRDVHTRDDSLADTLLAAYTDLAAVALDGGGLDAARATAVLQAVPERGGTLCAQPWLRPFVTQRVSNATHAPCRPVLYSHCVRLTPCISLPTSLSE